MPTSFPGEVLTPLGYKLTSGVLLGVFVGVSVRLEPTFDFVEDWELVPSPYWVGFGLVVRLFLLAHNKPKPKPDIEGGGRLEEQRVWVGRKEGAKF